MGELGSGAEEAHRDVGRRAAAVFDSICVVASPLGRVMADSSGAQVVLDQQAAAEWVRRNARERDRVLIKGSHAARLDQVVEALTSS
jgi:UDP-N-acetylmuramoyl-tripeptide--D-alanyl-D-alanine ligase